MGMAHTVATLLEELSLTFKADRRHAQNPLKPRAVAASLLLPLPALGYAPVKASTV